MESGVDGEIPCCKRVRTSFMHSFGYLGELYEACLDRSFEDTSVSIQLSRHISTVILRGR